MAEPIITLRNIRKSYVRRYQQFLYREMLYWVTRKKNTNNLFWALDDVSLDIYPGETVGIIGENGSGKSTLLKILSNVTDPTSGQVQINGRVSSLLELGAGFHPHLTGRENIYLNGVILGMTKKEVAEAFDRIVEFSGIKDFIDQPVMTYSSGMYVRLGFSIAIHMNPDLLLVDEVLAVGDEEFQRKCKQTLRDLRERGKTILIVSHDLSAIRDLCSRVYWLKQGRIEMEGDRDVVTFSYLTYVGVTLGMSTLSKGPLTVLFERGKLILFWKGIELTKNCCIFTQIFASNQSQWSVDAKWEIITFDPHHLRARGIWTLLPIEQHWSIELLDENSFIWRVRMIVRSDFDIRTDTVNIMLTDDYRQWFSRSASGHFPEEFFEQFGQRIINLGADEPCVGVKAVRLNRFTLPCVETEIVTSGEKFIPQVTNTEAKIRSRTIEFSRSENKDYYSNPQGVEYELVFRFEEDVVEQEISIQ